MSLRHQPTGLGGTALRAGTPRRSRSRAARAPVCSPRPHVGWPSARGRRSRGLLRPGGARRRVRCRCHAQRTGHYQRSGLRERAAAIIDELLQRATAPEELAALWTQRAQIALDTDEAKAMEAFDMALSYDPAYTLAVDGLLTVLERRGEWQQVVDIPARADGSPGSGAGPCPAPPGARVAASPGRSRERAASYLRTVTTLAGARGLSAAA